MSSVSLLLILAFLLPLPCPTFFFRPFISYKIIIDLNAINILVEKEEVGGRREKDGRRERRRVKSEEKEE